MTSPLTLRPEPLNVLIIGLNYSPETTGIAPYTSALARGLGKRGAVVRSLTAHPHYPAWEVQDGYGQWTSTETLDMAEVTRMRHFVPTNPEGLRRLASEVAFGLRVIFSRWGKPDVIVMVSPALFATAMAMLRAKLSRRAPSVNVWVQDIYSLGMKETSAGGSLATKVVTWVEKATLKAATGVVVIHPRFGDYLASKLGIDPKRIEVVRNWTHLEPADHDDIAERRRALGWSAEETIVLHAGNMGVKQGLFNVVEAARVADEQQKPVRFVLLGDGSQRESLVALGQGVEHLQFVDSLDDTAFQGALRAADILLVNEKLGISEMAVPSKLTSYFDAGRPVVAATDQTGVTAGEIQISNGGRVVGAEDPQALLDTVMELRRDRTVAAELGRNGRRYRTDVLGEEGAIDPPAGSRIWRWPQARIPRESGHRETARTSPRS